MKPRGRLEFSLVVLGLLAGAAPAARAFTSEQVLGARFPSSLTAEPAGRHFAWVERSEGWRNVWLASPRTAPPGVESRALTRYADDDGQDIGELHCIPGREALIYVRGGDFEAPDKPYPNPAHAALPPEQDLRLAPYGDGPRYAWAALGIGGQHLFLFPECDLAVVVTGWHILDETRYAAALARQIRSAVRDRRCETVAP